mmetsp:Transcript_64478/g.144728  ORF Transcript_64478/g.144728 Transcript_64478/m.144728 type:complete len:103 (-) Transcript_64478:494-802(-)
MPIKPHAQEVTLPKRKATAVPGEMNHMASIEAIEMYTARQSISFCRNALAPSDMYPAISWIFAADLEASFDLESSDLGSSIFICLIAKASFADQSGPSNKIP